MNYDEKCDIAGTGEKLTTTPADPKSLSDHEMRETGVEPASPKAPDPKSHRDQSAACASSGSVEAGATERLPAAPDRAESTTNRATRATDLIRILARAPAGLCGSCGAQIFWSIEPFGGRWVAVEAKGPGSQLPTWELPGAGVLHVCPPSLERLNDRRRESRL